MIIYREVKEEKEVCDFGCTHNVTYNELTIVEEVVRVKKDLWYGPTRTGTGYDIFYRGLHGELYIREADWSGTSSVLIDSQHRFWMTRPIGYEVNKNAGTGKVIPR